MEELFNHKAGRQPVGEDDSRFYDSNHPDFELLCEMGKALAAIWLRKLMIDFPGYDFRVYYTQYDNPIVRFHRVRPGEGNYFDEADFPDDIARGEIVIHDSRTERGERLGA